jgi:hypothetical protein
MQVLQLRNLLSGRFKSRQRRCGGGRWALVRRMQGIAGGMVGVTLGAVGFLWLDADTSGERWRRA